MFARSRQLFASAMFVVDGAIVAGAWFLAYWLRFFALPIDAPLGIPPFRLYVWTCAVLVPTALLVLRSFRLYRSARTARLGHELLALTQSMAVTSALAALGSYLVRGELSRLVIMVFFFTSIALFAASRITLRAWLRSLRRKGRNLRHVLVVGTGPLAELVLDKILRHRDFGLAVHGLIAPDPALVGTKIRGVEVIGSIEDLPRVADEIGIQIIYLALARPEWQAEERALQLLSDSTAAVRLVPDLSQAYRLNPSVEDFDGMPVVLVTESPEQGWNAVVKRAFDLFGSGIGLVLISPVLLVLAILVRLDSPGPVFYTQERVGLNGRRFRMIKFRSMRAEHSAGGATWTVANDPRRTRLGATLRKLSLDELPQLWNVFVGDMSLVGPRPEQPEHVDRFRGSIPRYMLRHHVRAGMTGWAQVNGLRGDTPLEQRIQYDLYYIEHWSLLFDLRILLLTVGRVFRDASAY
ncbi:MAG: undecaprenyl-phosphate glucose phosphotransferase [Candidatus Eisenbacteria bacterium]|uniref:Undecaprenyl-phosphate glucose phosphotransferase n=1 Tax=Eiseniibacteriota bacterium TaxID=2212470 RepID=A0A933SFJ7_UNCEI|nr:undecaprenyl-phosphate glucose phosphotransferase [Candidatus Eisenbacteria bacterium]